VVPSELTIMIALAGEKSNLTEQKEQKLCQP
jgi:hypothetical protein